MSFSRAWRLRVILSIPLVLFIPFLISVTDRSQISIPEERKISRSKKPDHLILGPAAGRGMPDRLHCQGLKALNKTHLPSSSQTLNPNDKISFVTVFTVCKRSLPSSSSHTVDESTNVVTVGNISYGKLERSMAILNTFVDFIKVSMPKSRVIILTDPSSEFSVKRNHVTVLPIEGDYSRENLMLQRIKSYIAFLEIKLKEHLETTKSANHYIFTDSDIAVVGDLGHVFQDHPHFHLALTFRNNRDQPLNSGFIAVRGTHDGILKAKLFLQGVLEVYSTRYMKASRMLGDQLALAWILKSRLPFSQLRFVKQKAFIGEIDGASILFLPCALYNWTPPEGAGQFHGMPLDVKVIHFKGSRKRLMLESWNFFNFRPLKLPDMLCLILRSGRTKYDF